MVDKRSVPIELVNEGSLNDFGLDRAGASRRWRGHGAAGRTGILLRGSFVLDTVVMLAVGSVAIIPIGVGVAGGRGAFHRIVGRRR